MNLDEEAVVQRAIEEIVKHRLWEIHMDGVNSPTVSLAIYLTVNYMIDLYELDSISDRLRNGL